MKLSRRAFLGSAAAGALLANRAWSAQPASKPPNILIIVADDMGYADAGCYGGEIETPNLDRLARGGLRFSQYYSAGRCWPSRACILTGYYAQQVRMDPPKGRLPQWARMLPHYFKPAGYRCYHSGKWHLGGAPKAVADGGFDRSYKLADQDRFFSPERHWLDDEALPAVERDSGYYATTAIADHALECLRDHAEADPDQPFLHYLAFTSPHFPLHALQKDIDRYRNRYLEGWDKIRRQRYTRQRELGLISCALSEREPDVVPSWNFPPEKLETMIGPGEVPNAVAWQSLSQEEKRLQATKMAIHAAMIDRMDQEIGRVLDQLEQMGAFEDTLILFVSDNGASAEQIIRGDMHDKEAAAGSADSYLCLGPGWSTSSNTPFRRHKHWNHEGGIASPLIVHWGNGGLDAGALRHTPGHFVDILPTLLDIGNVEPEPTWNGAAPPPLPGRSLAPVFEEDGALEREFLYFHHMGNRALRQGDWKLVAAGQDAPWELYNLKQDRSETQNLAKEHPETVRKLAEIWEEQERLYRKQAGY